MKSFMRHDLWLVITKKQMRSATKNSPFFEIANLLVRFDHVANFIVNAKSRHRASGTPEDSFSGLIDFLARARCPKT